MNRIDGCRVFAFLSLTAAMVLVGCAGPRFRDAGPPPAASPVRSLDRLAFTEYWTGIVFNGDRIGFSRLSVAPAAGATGIYEIRSEAVFAIRFLGFDKRVHLKALDRVAADLTLRAFDYDYTIDENRLQITGHQEGTRLTFTVRQRETTHTETLAPEAPAIAMSGVLLYPVLAGLEVGRRFTYPVFNGETRRIRRVEQEIMAYEESDLFAGRAYRVRTRLSGRQAEAWLDNRGQPLLEMSMGGVLMSYLESETLAKRYLASAALNKQERLLDLSRIRSSDPISRPEAVASLDVRLTGVPSEMRVPDDHRQTCRQQQEGWRCRIARQGAVGRTADDGGDGRRFLKSSVTVPAAHPAVRATAADIADGDMPADETASHIVDWMQANIEAAPADVFSALDVLETRKAECQGHAYLYTALARARGIPSRVVNGIVYSEPLDGFFYHAWAESRLDNRWIAVDPTLGQIPADATHIALIKGEAAADLMPLVDLIGRLGVDILAVAYARPPVVGHETGKDTDR